MVVLILGNKDWVKYTREKIANNQRTIGAKSSWNSDQITETIYITAVGLINSIFIFMTHASLHICVLRFEPIFMVLLIDNFCSCLCHFLLKFISVPDDKQARYTCWPKSPTWKGTLHWFSINFLHSKYYLSECAAHRTLMMSIKILQIKKSRLENFPSRV